jgi:cytochrome c
MCGTRCTNLLLAIAGAVFVLICLIAAGCSGQPTRAAKAQSANPQQAVVMSRRQAELIHQGKLIFDETPKYASSYVGNKLACNDCHIQSGTAAYAAPMIDLSGLFPMFNKRAGMSSRFKTAFRSVSPVVRPDVRCLMTAVRCRRWSHISIGSLGMG